MKLKMNKVANWKLHSVHAIVGIVGAFVLLTLTQCTMPHVADSRPEEPDVIFKSKCSACHDLNQALTAAKDETAWRQTITMMSKKPGSKIDQAEIEKLVGFHSERQKKEQELFHKNCVECHPPRSFAKTKTAAEWQETVRSMLAKKSGLVNDHDLEFLVNYHIREQRSRLSPVARTSKGKDKEPAADVFTQECCSCHNLERVLTAEKDEAAWRQTIKAMSQKQGSPVKEGQIEELVSYHAKLNETEVMTFQQDCTQCHSAEKSLERINTKDEWRGIIKRMMTRAHKAISDCQIDLLIDFHTKNQKKTEALFGAKCTECHNTEMAMSTSGDRASVERTITSMLNRTGKEPSYDLVRKLLEYHMEKQRRDQAVFEKDCTRCHPAGMALEKKKSREEWRETINRMQKKAPGTISDEEVDTIVAYHVRRSKALR